MDVDINELFKEPFPVEGMDLDFDTPKPQRAITSLPDGFQIRTMSDIRTLQEVVALKHTKGIRLYRGHESCTYKIESTIVRHTKGKDKKCSVQDVLEAENKGLNLFCQDVFKEDWLHNKLRTSDEILFKMSIGRHLGLPCRLIDVTACLETAIWFAVMNPRFYNEDGEVVLIVLDKNNVSDTNQSPFNATKLSYAHEPFMADSLNELPLGEQRRFIQYGHFIWVDDSSLLNEEQVISDSVFHIEHFTIPWQAKLGLAIELYRDVYSGCAYQSDIENIKERILEQA
jgi:hypothetical protein